MAACTNLAVTIHGAGGHGSMPAQTVDPVVIAAHVVTRLQTIISREVPPEETVVVTVGKLHAGTQANIIPHSAELEINIRSFDYWFIGATPESRWVETPGASVAEKMRHLEMPHSPYYFPGNAVTLRTGIEALAAGALAYLAC